MTNDYRIRSGVAPILGHASCASRKEDRLVRPATSGTCDGLNL